VKLGHNQCKKCFKYGHWGREYKAKPKTEEAYTAQKEESLLLLQATPLFQIHARLEAPSSVIPVNCRGVHLVRLREEKVFAQLGEKECDAGTWIYDTGATNHMSGSWATFLELDKTIRGTVCSEMTQWLRLRDAAWWCSNARMGRRDR
jgi:hypothetical protein